MSESSARPVPHGTHGGYTHHKCRCDSCKAAMRAYQVAWRAKNAERIKARDRAYYARNQERAREQSRLWYLRNQREQRERARERYARNRERRLALVSAWTKANPQSRSAYRVKRRWAMADTACRITERDWRRLCARFDHRCAYCGEHRPLTRDHVVPLARGGRHAIGNLLPACGSCNSSKNDSLLIEWRMWRQVQAA